MPDRRSRDSRSAAEAYAPSPEGSSILYGLISTVVVGMTFWVVGSFYGFNWLSQPVLFVASGVAGFVGGVALRKLRKRRHNEAYDHEYEKRD